MWLDKGDGEAWAAESGFPDGVAMMTDKGGEGEEGGGGESKVEWKRENMRLWEVVEGLRAREEEEERMYSRIVRRRSNVGEEN